MVRKLLILIFLLILSSFATAQIPMPIGVGGLITVDDIPIGGITVQIENLNTGEVRTTTTAYDTPHTMCGYYFDALFGQNGDVIKVTVIYGGLYSNTTFVDTNQNIQFCNISISSEEPYEPPDDPPYNPPEDPPYEPPYEPPDDPENNETEEPMENDTGDDIPNMYNLTVAVFDNTTNDPISNASVTIYGSNETKVTESHTNESGEAKFLLEEGNYIVTVKKDKHFSSYYAVSLSASMEYTAYMQKNEQNNIPHPAQPQEEGFPAIYTGVIGAIIAIICIAVFFYWRRSA